MLTCLYNFHDCIGISTFQTSMSYFLANMDKGIHESNIQNSNRLSKKTAYIKTNKKRKDLYITLIFWTKYNVHFFRHTQHTTHTNSTHPPKIICTLNGRKCVQKKNSHSLCQFAIVNTNDRLFGGTHNRHHTSHITYTSAS